MDDKEITEGNPFAGGEQQNNRPPKDMTIVGYNLLVFVGYTLILKLTGDMSLIFEGIFLVLHVLVCIVMAISSRSWFWFLGGVMVLIIGISTCSYLF
ncbi:MAG: hypothetical protein ABIN13_12035 [Mucilaginibacter sp.]